jgi:hypothetical protein
MKKPSAKEYVPVHEFERLRDEALPLRHATTAGPGIYLAYSYVSGNLYRIKVAPRGGWREIAQVLPNC